MSEHLQCRPRRIPDNACLQTDPQLGSMQTFYGTYSSMFVHQAAVDA
ncbi:MAG TPA: hypothetical protein QGG37_11280 [Chloroflexota bacterium]|nr:hypothetical protein [Chloroflexota bacterium]